MILFFLIQIRSVQVYVAKKTAIYLSDKLQAHVEIGSVDIQFYKNIVLRGFYIEDKHQDTLFYSKELKICINDINFNKRKIDIKSLIISNTKTAIIKYKLEFMDFERIRAPTRTSTSTPTSINYRRT